MAHDAAIDGPRKPRSRTCKLAVAALAILIVAGITIGALFAAGVLKTSSATSSAADSSSGNGSNGPRGDNSNGSGTSTSPSATPTDAANKTANTGGMLGKLVTPNDKGMLLGAHIWGDGIQWSAKDPNNWNKLADFNGAGFGAFVSVDNATGIKDPEAVIGYAKQIKDAKGFMLFTLEPMDGLQVMTDSVIDKVVAVLVQINDMGVPVMLRFAHEMNGAWYAWGQKPDLYKATWIRLTKAVRAKAKLTSTVWAANVAAGYPWTDTYSPAKGSPDFVAMDTNKDGAVDAKDDPFAPYYPGNDWVDWIGFSLFHFGPYPFGKNVVPESGAVAGVLEPATWSITQFASSMNKPFGVFEAGAVYYPSGSGANDAVLDASIKTTWLSQIAAMSKGSANHARISLLMWFEIAKIENSGQARDFALFKSNEVADKIKPMLKAGAFVNNA
ncbi:hypothetical protein GGF31_005332 [Allomyces arbusculus]|nr:hypothetical protein GGF31_005332 [Allomyces arbusculus]